MHGDGRLDMQDPEEGLLERMPDASAAAHGHRHRDDDIVSAESSSSISGSCLPRSPASASLVCS